MHSYNKEVIDQMQIFLLFVQSLYIFNSLCYLQSKLHRQAVDTCVYLLLFCRCNPKPFLMFPTYPCVTSVSVYCALFSFGSCTVA